MVTNNTLSTDYSYDPSQQAVIIAGMHRSGTSMVANILHLAGVYLGDPDLLLGASKDNQKGHWENVHFLDLNEKILAKLGAGWDFIPNFTDGWERSASLEPLRQQAYQLVSKFEGHLFWGWKDPRNTVLASFWQSLLPTAKFILCLRNPAEVANSLYKRNYFSNPASFHLWKIYYQIFLKSIKENNYIVTHYDSWFYNPHAELRRLGKFIDLPLSEAIITESCKEISPSLRHGRIDLGQLLKSDAPEDVKQLYQELCQEAGSVFEETLLNWSDPPLILSHKPISESSISATEKDTAKYAQLFVPTATGYREENSYFNTVVLDKTKTYIFYPIIEESLDHYQFRFDPLNQAGLIDIKSINIRVNDKTELIWSANEQQGGFEHIKVTGTAKRLNQKTNSLYIFSYDNDPQIILPPISGTAMPKSPEIEITMKIEPNYKSLADYISLFEVSAGELSRERIKSSRLRIPTPMNISSMLSQTVEYLVQNKFPEARENLATILRFWPDNLAALVLLDYLTQISMLNPALRLIDHSPFVAWNLDAPRNGEIVRGSLNIHGWILTSQPKENVDIRILLEYRDCGLTVERGFRDDVLSAYESYQEPNPMPGFGAWLDTTQYENGEYILLAIAVSNHSVEQIGKVSFSINNLGE